VIIIEKGSTEERKTEERKNAPNEFLAEEEGKTGKRTIKKFEDIEAWKEGMRLSVRLYKQLSECKDYSLRDQIQRSAVSIPSNISEGYDRDSNKEYIRFLHIARGSCAELRTQLYIIKELGYISKALADEFIEKTRKISAMLYNLIQTRMEKFDK
jgi:four helix bundle protein